MTEDIRELFLCTLDTNNLKLKNLPNFIFLCGGDISDYEVDSNISPATTSEDVPPTVYKSMRKAVYDASLFNLPISKRLVIAEFYDDWIDHGVIKNLIDLEIFIADIASSIVLILEAPGAYAELGSFSVIEDISDKLILIVNDNLVGKKTYANLGPIKYLEDNDKTVFRYNWNVRYSISGDTIKTVLDSNAYETAEMILNQISDKLDTVNIANPKINYFKKGHLCFLIGDLIYNFHALKFNEISYYLRNYFFIDELSKRLIKSCLYILEKFEFIKIVVMGDTYFISTAENKGFIKYSYDVESKNEASFKGVNDVRNSLERYYAENDKYRFKVIEKEGMYGHS